MTISKTQDFKTRLADASVVYIKPGDVYISKHGEWLHSVIGSCICVCLFAPGKAIGGMNHFMLSNAASDSNRLNFHGPTAMQSLHKGMLRADIKHAELRAKVFGGSQRRLEDDPRKSVGGMNIQFALSWLQEADIPIVRKHLGGQEGRKIYFDTGSNTVWLHKINPR